MQKIKQIWHNEKTRQFVRFCIVGCLSTAMHYGIYLLLLWLYQPESELWTSIAYSIGYAISLFFNLWLTAVFTFKEQVNIHRGIGFFLSHGVNYLLHIGLLNLYLWLGIPEQWAPVPVYLVAVPVNFILVRTVFKRIK